MLAIIDTSVYIWHLYSFCVLICIIIQTFYSYLWEQKKADNVKRYFTPYIHIYRPLFFKEGEINNILKNISPSSCTTEIIIAYRVSHETWQFVNGFECLLPYIILDIEDFLKFISLMNSFSQIYFTLNSISYNMTDMLYFLLFSFVSQNLTNYGRRHLKLCTNCHVSWDTL